MINAGDGPQVTVFGAAGFIGRHTVAALLRAGWSVRAFVHVAEEVPFAPGPRLAVMRGDIREAAAVIAALRGSRAAVNLAGAKNDEPESEAVNVGGARNLAAAARPTGCTRLVHISTQAVKIARPGVYARTKLAADRVLESSGLDVTILRPSIVYGAGRSGVFETMRRCLERWPVVPVLGDGRWVSAPVHVDDVAHAIAVCLATPATIGRCYDLGGPDFVSLDDLLDRIAQLSGRRARKLHVPFGVALAAVRIVKRLCPSAPFTVSNVLGSNQPTPIDLAPARRDLGFAPRPLAAGLAELAAAGEPAEVDDAGLCAEAHRFGRYLLDVEPAPELQQRYALAVRTCLEAADDADVRFVRRHPWALPFVDAAAAWLRPSSGLRRRLLLMAAVLEASPQHASWFLAEPTGRAALLTGAAWRGVKSGLNFLAGACLLAFVR